jgi:hypothetical protein
VLHSNHLYYTIIYIPKVLLGIKNAISTIESQEKKKKSGDFDLIKITILLSLITKIYLFVIYLIIFVIVDS